MLYGVVSAGSCSVRTAVGLARYNNPGVTGLVLVLAIAAIPEGVAMLARYGSTESVGRSQ